MILHYVLVFDNLVKESLHKLQVIVVALNSGIGLSWSCDWDSQVL